MGSMTIAVIGGSKGIGWRFAELAVSRGHRVRTLSRTTPPVNSDRISSFLGDARDQSVLARVIEGADAVVCTLGVANPLRKTTFLSDATRVLVQALETAKIRRLLVVTGFGAGESAGKGGFIVSRLLMPVMANLYADKSRQEDVVRASDLEWTVVRPGLLTNGPARGVSAEVNAAHFRFGKVSRFDVATFLLDSVEAGAYIRSSPVVVQAAG